MTKVYTACIEDCKRTVNGYITLVSLCSSHLNIHEKRVLQVIARAAGHWTVWEDVNTPHKVPATTLKIGGATFLYQKTLIVADYAERHDDIVCEQAIW